MPSLGFLLPGLCSAIGNEFRLEGRTAGKGNTLSDLGIDRCSVGLFVRAFVCAFPQRIGHGQRQRRAFWPFRYSQGRVRGKSWKVKAGAREGGGGGTGQCVNLRTFLPSAPTVILACKILGHGHIGRWRIQVSIRFVVWLPRATSQELDRGIRFPQAQSSPGS